jgi:hypothetical protein
MKKLLLLLFVVIITITTQAQYLLKEGSGGPNNKFGAYVSLVSETFYNRNMASSIGLRYKETRIGYYH